jgi:hypothetical protein
MIGAAGRPPPTYKAGTGLFMRSAKLFIAFVLVGAGLLAWAGPASAATDGPFTFTTSGTTATITNYDNTGPKNLVIPATVTDGVNTYDVTVVGDDAFSSNGLTSVTIPDSVTSIGAYAFYGNQLTSATIGDSVTTIGHDAFSDSGLTSVTIGDSVTSIGASAFSINELTSVTIPDSVTTIGNHAFSYNELTSVTIPDSVTAMGDFAFFNNELASVMIPDSVTAIGEGAFNGNLLTSVTIPDSVTAIGDFAFASNQLTSVTIGDSVTAIGDFAFEDNPGLVSVVFEGNAPTVTDAAVSGESFDTASGSLVLTYFFGATGFSTPTWHGYTTAVTPRPAVTGLAPTITGLAQVGQTLTADPGPVNPDDATLAYQWNAGGDPISDATGPTYQLTPAQEGQTITVTIIATAPGLTAQTETSDPTAVVAPADTTPETPTDPDPTPGTPTDSDTATSADAALPDTGGRSRSILAIGLASILAGALTLTATRVRAHRH